MGPRPGLRKVFSMALAAGKYVQSLYAMGRSVGVEYRQATPIQLVGGANVDLPDGQGSIPGNVLTACCWIYQPGVGFIAGFSDPDTTTYPNAPAGAVAWSSGFCRDAAAQTQGFAERVPYFGAFATIVQKNYGGSVGLRTISRLHFFECRYERAVAPGYANGPQIFSVTNTSALLWSEKELEDKQAGGSLAASPQAIEAKAIVVHGSHVFVAASRYIYVFAADASFSGVPAGTYIKRYELDGWAWTIEDMRLSVGSTTELMVAYRGTPGVGGPVTTNTNKEGSYVRSAIAKFEIDVDSATDPLSHVFHYITPAKLDAGDPRYENHIDLRFFEEDTTGRGRVPLAFVPFADGEVMVAGNKEQKARGIVGTTNDGLGPTGAEVPSGGGGYWNVAVLQKGTQSDRNPFLLKFDTESIKESRLGGYNDIPYDLNGALSPNNGFGPEKNVASNVAPIFTWKRGREFYTAAEITALGGSAAVDAIYAAGSKLPDRRSFEGFIVTGVRTGGASIRAYDASGALLWTNDLATLHPKKTLAMLEQSGRWVAGGKRTDDSVIWWGSLTDGTIQGTLDLGVNGDVYALDAREWGIVFGTKRITR